MLARAHPRGSVIDAGNYLRDPDRAIARISSGRIARGRVAVGHIPYGLFRAHLPRDSRYVTVLRDPVERILSHYHGHIRRTDRTEALGLVTAESLQEALELRPSDLSNLATRFLCGDPSPMGELPADALDRAKANLRDFEFVGITERFDESIVLMQRALGLPTVLYERLHVSPDRPSADEISEEDRSLIVEMNTLDRELYSFARTLFDERVASGERDLATDAAQLGHRSEVASERADAEIRDAADWLALRLPPGAPIPVAQLREAGRDAGISDRALRRAAKLLQARLERDPSGERRWARPEVTPDG